MIQMKKTLKKKKKEKTDKKKYKALARTVETTEMGHFLYILEKEMRYWMIHHYLSRALVT